MFGGEQWFLPRDFVRACLKEHKDSSSLRSKVLVGQNRFEISSQENPKRVSFYFWNSFSLTTIDGNFQ